MSRSLDSTSLTTLLSIAIVPAVISSSPASIRSSVDLPQPDGPTSTMNSPSLMSKPIPWMTLVLPKLFSMSLNDTDAMVDAQLSGIRNEIRDSALYCAGREAAYHVTLERVVDRRRRQRIDHADRHQQLPRRIVRRQKIAQCNAERDLPVVRQQQKRIQILVPSQQQRIGADRDQRRHHQR